MKFKDPETVIKMERDEIIALKQSRKERLVYFLAKRQGFSQEWIRDVLENDRPIGVWDATDCLRIKRLEKFADLLEKR